MLRAVHKGRFNHDFTVVDHTGQPLAQADLSNWCERKKVEIGRTHYEASTQRREAKEFFPRRPERPADRGGGEGGEP